MQHEGGFTLVELLVVILIIGVLIALAVPNLRIVQSQARVTAVQLNMRTVEQAITSYYAENGHFADDFYEDGYGYIFDGGVKDQTLGAFPTNPFTGKEMDPDEFNPWDYDEEADITNTVAGGPNDDWGYGPGEMRYGTWSPLGQYYATRWGLIAFDGHGYTIRHWDQDGNEVIVVLYQ
jgi:prepilin-type N-terminal cleavage/methylation domain-containing protein